jgi:hypothetical protein
MLCASSGAAQAYLLVRCLLGCLTVLARREACKDAELPVLRHEAQAHACPPRIDLAEHRVRRKQVLGGLTHEYQIAA